MLQHSDSLRDNHSQASNKRQTVIRLTASTKSFEPRHIERIVQRTTPHSRLVTLTSSKIIQLLKKFL